MVNRIRSIVGSALFRLAAFISPNKKKAKK